MSCETRDTICYLSVHVYVLRDTTCTIRMCLTIHSMVSLLNVSLALVANVIPFGNQYDFIIIILFSWRQGLITECLVPKVQSI